MISRRILRIKVMQALYEYFQSNNDNIDVCEKRMLKRIDKIYDLYLYQLSLLIEIVELAKRKTEDAKNKYLPTSEDLNPNTRFIDNQFLNHLVTNKELLQKINHKKIYWGDEQELIRAVYDKLKESVEYKEYLNFKDNSYKIDKSIIITLFDKYISEFPNLLSYYEDKNSYWADDCYVVNSMVIKTISSFSKDLGENNPLLSLYKNDSENENNDIDFIKELFKQTILHDEEYENMISLKTQNWEIERIAMIDILLMKMALCEILEMPTIPVKVTFDEYLEIAKMFSTSKSSNFINGVLDKIITELNATNKIKKHGRGLMQ